MSDRFAAVRLATIRPAIRLLALAGVLILGLVYANSGRAATVTCPGTFQVEHNDKVGVLSLRRARTRSRRPTSAARPRHSCSPSSSTTGTGGCRAARARLRRE